MEHEVPFASWSQRRAPLAKLNWPPPPRDGCLTGWTCGSRLRCTANGAFTASLAADIRGAAGVEHCGRRNCLRSIRERTRIFRLSADLVGGRPVLTRVPVQHSSDRSRFLRVWTPGGRRGQEGIGVCREKEPSLPGNDCLP